MNEKSRTQYKSNTPNESWTDVTPQTPLPVGVEIGAYSINNLDESADPAYYGFTDADGNWYIMRITDSTGEFKYVKGTSGYTTAWTNRASQSYDYYNATF